MSGGAQLSGFLRGSGGGSGGGAVAVSPADIAGLVLWLKADALAGADGDAVTTWINSAGGVVASPTQSNAGNKPVLKTGILNSLPIVRFDGGDYLSCSDAGMPTTDFSAFVVAKIPTVANGTYPSLVFWGNSRYIGLSLGTDGIIGTNTYMLDPGGNSIKIRDATVNAPKLYTAQRRGSYHWVSINMTYNSGMDMALLATLRGDNALAVGSYNSQNSYGGKITGDIAEIIVYNMAISGVAFQSIAKYLSDKWGVALV
jgi:hypothetical protein